MKATKPVEIEFDGGELVAAVREMVQTVRAGRAGELRSRVRRAILPDKARRNPGRSKR